MITRRAWFENNSSMTSVRPTSCLAVAARFSPLPARSGLAFAPSRHGCGLVGSEYRDHQPFTKEICFRKSVRTLPSAEKRLIEINGGMSRLLLCRTDKPFPPRAAEEELARAGSRVELRHPSGLKEPPPALPARPRTGTGRGRHSNEKNGNDDDGDNKTTVRHG